MKLKNILYFVGILASLSLSAGTPQEISYYDKAFPRSGNIEYLNSRCKLDLYLPDESKNFPTLVWFHGGGLSGGNKHYPQGINGKKIAVAAVNYRLSGKNATTVDCLNDAAAALAWVLKHIKEFGGDPAKVYVSGHSAGGYLTAMLTLNPKYLKLYGADTNQIRCALPLSGQMTTHFRVLGERRRKDPKTPSILIDDMAPIAHARKNVPEMIFVVGDTDVEWPARVEENYLLCARLKRCFGNRNVRCFSLPTFNHGTMLAPALLLVNQTILKDNQPNK